MIPLSVEIQTQAASRLLEYGVLGIFLILTAFIAFHFYKKIEENSNEWKEVAKSMSENYTNIVLEQNAQNKKLISLQRDTVNQNREFHNNINKKIDLLPATITKEIEFLNRVHYTPANPKQRHD